MAETIQELLVKLTPEGISETTSELEGQREEFEATADAVDDQTSRLSSFSNRWKGAAGVIIAGLGTLAAGLLSQLPIIGQVFTALQILFRQFILLIDEELRPALRPVVQHIIDLANALGDVEGPLGEIVSFLALTVGIFAILAVLIAPVVGLIVALGVVAAATSVPIAVIVGLLAGALVVALLAVAAIIAFFVKAWQNNWFSIRDIVSGAIEFITAILEGDFAKAFDMVLGLAADFTQGFGSLMVGLISTIVQAVAVFAARVQTGFDTFFSVVLSEAKRWANAFVGIIETAVNKAIGALPDAVTSELGLSTVSIARPFDPGSRAETLAGVRARGRRREQRAKQGADRVQSGLERQLEQLVSAIQNQTQTTELSLDSQRVAEETRQWSDGRTSDRGRIR